MHRRTEAGLQAPQTAAVAVASRRVQVPQVDLDGGYWGPDHLLRIFEPLWDYSGPLLLDFARCGFMSAVGAAILAALKLSRDGLGQPTAIDWGTLDSAVRRQFGRWRLTDLFGGATFRWTDTAIPLLHQQQLDKGGLVEYISTLVVDKMPDMTPRLAKRTRNEVCELFCNIFQHSASNVGGFAIGQRYPNARQFQLCVCDCGVGIVRRVQEAGEGLESPAAAVEWALGKGHSTNRECPSGLGLSLLQDFVKINRGQFRIYANTGCYHQAGSNRTCRCLDASFPGTLIELRLNVEDGATYDLDAG
jgi:hypothetical protein